MPIENAAIHPSKPSGHTRAEPQRAIRSGSSPHPEQIAGRARCFLEIFPAWTTAEQGPKCSRFGNGNRGVRPRHGAEITGRDVADRSAL